MKPVIMREFDNPVGVLVAARPTTESACSNSATGRQASIDDIGVGLAR